MTTPESQNRGESSWSASRIRLGARKEDDGRGCAIRRLLRDAPHALSSRDHENLTNGKRSGLPFHRHHTSRESHRLVCNSVVSCLVLVTVQDSVAQVLDRFAAMKQSSTIV